MLELLVEAARAGGLQAQAVTFDPHPGLVLGRGAPPLLTTLERRAELVHSLGVDMLAICPFDAELASWSPDRFVRELLVSAIGVGLVVVGADFRFGAQRAGDFALLASLGGSLGFETRAAPLVGDDKGPFSSSRVRDAVRAGDMAEAAHVLGRPHSFEGTVVRGAQLGRTIGFPTANIGEIVEMVPPRGVYAVRVDGHGAGVMNIGVRPTMGGMSETREIYLLEGSPDLYGRRIRTHVLARIRDERRFPSVDELKAQIARDVEAARALTK